MKKSPPSSERPKPFSSPENLQARADDFARYYQESFVWTEDKMAAALVNFYLSTPWTPLQVTAAPNVNAFGWESDLVVITKSRMVYEVEIKISAADLRAEFGAKPKKTKAQKHRWIQSRKFPVNRFYVAVPEALGELAINLVPAEYGIISVSFQTRGTYEYPKYPDLSRARFETVVVPMARIRRKAPILNKESRADEALRLKLLESCYHKVWNRLGWDNLTKEGTKHG